MPNPAPANARSGWKAISLYLGVSTEEARAAVESGELAADATPSATYADMDVWLARRLLPAHVLDHLAELIADADQAAKRAPAAHQVENPTGHLAA